MWFALFSTKMGFVLSLSENLSIWIFFFNVYFILRETENEQGRGTERGRERIPSRLRAVSTEPDMGLELMNHETMT